MNLLLMEKMVNLGAILMFLPTVASGHDEISRESLSVFTFDQTVWDHFWYTVIFMKQQKPCSLYPYWYITDILISFLQITAAVMCALCRQIELNIEEKTYEIHINLTKRE